jgi:hypothetical protein
MSLAAACGWTLVRSLAVVIAGWPMCGMLHGLIAGTSARLRGAVWLLMLAPFLFPGLLAGYAYAGTALKLGGWFAAHDQLSDHLLCTLLLLFKCAPVGAVVLHFTPAAPLSAEAVHVRRLAMRPRLPLLSRVKLEWSLLAHGPLRAHLPAAALMWLVAFQDFEIASLLNVPAWTVWLFDAQAQGIQLGESLRLAVWPLAIQIVVLTPALAAAFRSRQLRPAARCAPPARTRFVQTAAWSYLLVAAAVGVVIPFVLVGQDLPQGLYALIRGGRQLFDLGREIRHGLFFAIVSAVAAMLAGAGLLGRFRKLPPWIQGSLAALLAVPGLMSSLAVSLLTLALFQRTPLSVFYGTPIPMIVGLTAFLLPRAMIVELLWKAFRRDEPIHLSRLLERSPAAEQREEAGELRWQLYRRRQFWGAALVAWWGYLELTVASLLAPAAMVPATVRLYNQMHFGRNATLTAMTGLTVFIPFLLVFAILTLRRPCGWLMRR